MQRLYNKMKLYVIKIGGNVIDNPQALEFFLSDFAAIKGNKILVHGGGKVATEISKGLGIEAQMVDGRRVTDAETLKIVTMVYAGLINKNVVAQLQAKSCNAIGLTGADGNIIKSHKRVVKTVDYGFVGDVDEINTGVLKTLIDANLTPIIAPITHNKEGVLLNTNADTVASTLAVGMSQLFDVELIYCFELKGVLRDFEDKNSVINDIDKTYYNELKEAGIVSKGMIPKLDNSFDAIEAGVSAVRICHADDLLKILNDNQKLGTTLK